MAKRDGLRMSLQEFQRKFPEEYEKLLANEAKIGKKLPKGNLKYNVKPTTVDWHGELVVFPSKTEARVAERLLQEEKVTLGARLYRQVHVPLLSIASNDRGKPLVFTVDFVLVYSTGVKRYIEAKTGRRSRDYPLRRRAAEAWLGQRIEEVDR